MKLQISDLTTERQWRAAIGTDQARFVKLLALFTASYGDLFGYSVAQRIVVEHAHAGLKRYRILADRLRMHNFMLYDVVLGVCAGLWNFYLSR